VFCAGGGGFWVLDGIVHAIDESSILVLILSEQAVASAHVGREIERAASKRRPIVALRIDAAPLTAAFEYFLNQSQWIEGGGDAAISRSRRWVGVTLRDWWVRFSVGRVSRSQDLEVRVRMGALIWG
jgi:hypothetical protein